ncbi:MAG: hypothetical protein ACYTGG_03395 [Planctomycetota bacterium]|jgi:hypothetical protein
MPRWSLLLATVVLVTSLAAGCARRAANDWAQTAPAIEPTRGGGNLVGFSAWNDHVEPRSLDTISQTGIALRD